jgi:hypothetical protein
MHWTPLVLIVCSHPTVEEAVHEGWGTIVVFLVGLASIFLTPTCYWDTEQNVQGTCSPAPGRAWLMPYRVCNTNNHKIEQVFGTIIYPSYCLS